MKLPGSIRDYIDGLELDADEKEKLEDYVKGLEDLPEDPTEREAKKIVRSAQQELSDRENRIVRQKSPKKKPKEDGSSDEETPDEDDDSKKVVKKEKVKIEEGLKLSFKAFLTATQI